MAHDVFISHSSKDKLTADAICHALEQNGVRCWIAPRDVKAGANYGAEILRAIRDCKLLVLIFSRNSNNSNAVHKELETAFANKKIIIPFRIENVGVRDEIGFFIAGNHWLDSYPNDQVFAKLVEAVRMSLGYPVVGVLGTPSSRDLKPKKNWINKLFGSKSESVVNKKEIAEEKTIITPSSQGELIAEKERVLPNIQQQIIVENETAQKAVDNIPKEVDKSIEIANNTAPVKGNEKITFGGFKIPNTGVTRSDISSLLVKGLINETEAAWLESAGDSAWLPSGRIKMTIPYEESQIVGNSLSFDGTKNLTEFLSDTFQFDRQIVAGELSSLEFIKDTENENAPPKIRLTLSDGTTYEQDNFKVEQIYMMLDNGDYGGAYTSNITRFDFDLEAETTLSRIRYTYIKTSDGRNLCTPYSAMEFEKNRYLYLDSSDNNHFYYPLSMHSIEFKDKSILSDTRLGILCTYDGEKVVLSGKEIEDKRLTYLTSEGIRSILLKDIDSILFHSGEALSVPSKESIVSRMLADGIITKELEERISSATESYVPRGRAVVKLCNKEEIEIIANSFTNEKGLSILEYSKRLPGFFALNSAQITELAQSADGSVWIATLADNKQVQLRNITNASLNYYGIDKNGQLVSFNSHNIIGIKFYHDEYFVPSSLPYVYAKRPDGQNIALPQALLLYEQLDSLRGIPYDIFLHHLPGLEFSIAFSRIRSIVTSTGFNKEKGGFPISVVARNGESMDVVLAMHSYFCNSWLNIPTGYGRFRLHLQGASVNVEFE